MLGLACLGALASASVQAEDVDLLSETGAPSSAEIAATISSLSAEVGRIDIPPPTRIEIIDPRSLRQEVGEEEQTTISLSADVLFGFDEDALTARAEQIVRDAAEERLGDTVGPVQVIGHTDSIGEDAYNQDLSERRAGSVAAILREVLGAEREIETEGRSFHDPVAENARPDGEDNPRDARRTAASRSCSATRDPPGRARRHRRLLNLIEYKAWSSTAWMAEEVGSAHPQSIIKT